MNQFSYQADDETLRMIAELAGWWGLPTTRHNTQVIARCVEKIHNEETMKRKIMGAKTIESEIKTRVDQLLDGRNSEDMVAQLTGEIRAYASVIGLTKSEAIEKFKSRGK